MEKWFKRIAFVAASAFAIGALAIMQAPTLAILLGIGAVVAGGAMANGLDPINKVIKPAFDFVARTVNKLVRGISNKIKGLFGKKPSGEEIEHIELPDHPVQDYYEAHDLAFDAAPSPTPRRENSSGLTP